MHNCSFGLPRYHALLLNRHKMAVASSVILLRPQADGPEMARPLDTRDPRWHVTVSFSFDVIRIWQRPVEESLSGGIGTLPLALGIK